MVRTRAARSRLESLSIAMMRRQSLRSLMVGGTDGSLPENPRSSSVETSSPGELHDELGREGVARRARTVSCRAARSRVERTRASSRQLLGHEQLSSTQLYTQWRSGS